MRHNKPQNATVNTQIEIRSSTDKQSVKAPPAARGASERARKRRHQHRDLKSRQQQQAARQRLESDRGEIATASNHQLRTEFDTFRINRRLMVVSICASLAYVTFALHSACQVHETGPTSQASGVAVAPIGGYGSSYGQPALPPIDMSTVGGSAAPVLEYRDDPGALPPDTYPYEGDQEAGGNVPAPPLPNLGTDAGNGTESLPGAETTEPRREVQFFEASPPTETQPHVDTTVARAPAQQIASAATRPGFDALELTPPDREPRIPVELENWQIPPIDNKYQRQQYVEYVNKILGKDWEADYRRGQQSALEHFAYARKIYADDPGLYFAYAIFQWHNQRTDRAIENLEMAVSKVRDGLAPAYLAPWKMLIRLKVQKKQYPQALRLAVEMADQLKRYSQLDTRSGVQTERIVNGYVAWLGAIAGYMEGPRSRETGYQINHAGWDERINDSLTPDQRRLFQSVKSDIAIQFASELRRADDVRQQWDVEEQQKRASGERRRHQIGGRKKGLNAKRYDSWHDQRTLPRYYYWKTPHMSMWHYTIPPYRRVREHYLRGYYNDVEDHFTQTIYDTPDKPPLRFPYAISTYLPNNAEQEREMFLLTFPSLGSGVANLAQVKQTEALADSRVEPTSDRR